jgi:PPP family 3-phenylpropionic acid transporter
MSVSAVKGITGSRRDHWALKGLYFFQFAAVGQFFTFVNVYYRDIGLSGTQIGLVGTMGGLVGIFSTTLWGILRDRFGKTRLLFLIAVFGVILAVMGLSAARAFYRIVLAACILALFNSALSPLLDSTTLVLLGDQRQRYGSFRVWGSIGFIITSSVIGLIYERTGLHAMFIGYALIMGMFLIVSLFIPNQPIHLSGSLLRGLNEMVRQPLWMLFAVSVFFLWLANSGTMAFISVTINVMGGSDGLIGLSWTTAAIAELPVMIFSGVLLRRFGAVRLLFVSFLGYFFRIFLYALMPSPNWAPIIGTLNAVSFVPFWVSAITYASDLAPPNLKATAQGLLFSVMSLSNVVGALFSGWLFDKIGPQGLFGVLAGSCVVALMLFGFGQWILRNKISRPLNAKT